MNPERWRQVEEVFQGVVERAPEERAAFLSVACADDAELRREVESLLARDGGGTQSPFADLISAAAASLSDDSENPAQAMVGRRIGAYRLTGVVGQGGMAEVYRAVRDDDQYRKEVALKIIRRELTSDSMLARFRSERQILATLDHPHIARFLEGGTTDDGRPYFVMEYIEGRPITAYVRDARLSLKQRLALFRAVCAAVQHAHRNLIVHRDLKPSNILVTEDGSPKLLDFGIAKLLNPEYSPTLPTIAQTVPALRLLTPEYASPEQVRGENVTTATDVYSLGTVLYEVLTGVRPLQLGGKSFAEIERIVGGQEPPRPSEVIDRKCTAPETCPADEEPTVRLATRSARETKGEGRTTVFAGRAAGERPTAPQADRLRRELSGDLDNIVMMAMRKEPERRYASVEQLSEDIGRYLDGWPVRACPDTFRYRAAKFVRRHRVGVAFVTALFVLLAGFAVTMTVQANRIARERDRANRLTEFLVRLFKVSDPSEARGNTITAREILDQGAGRIKGELAEQPEARASLMDAMGRVYQNLGLYKSASPLLEDAFNTRRSILPAQHLDVAASADQLAEVWREQGQYEKAEPLSREALATRLDLLGEGSAEVAESMNNLGGLLKARGKFDEAESLFRRSLEIRRKVLGAEHELVATSLNNLGTLLQNKGQFDEAEFALREALALRRKLFGGPHPAVALSINNLALLLKIKGDEESSETLYREALAMHRQLFGAEHPYIATTLNNLGRLLLEKGDPAAAEAHLREALKIDRRLLGAEHPEVAITMNNLGLALEEGKNFREAEQILREALAVRQKALGPEHPAIANNLYSVGRLLLNQRNYGEAEQFLNESLAMMRKTLKPEHPTTSGVLLAIGRLKNERGEFQNAEPMLREALQIRLKTLPAEHPQIVSVKGMLGECLAGQQRREEAEPLLLESYQTTAAKRGPQHEDTQKNVQRLIKLYAGWNKPDEASRYRALLNVPGKP